MIKLQELYKNMIFRSLDVRERGCLSVIIYLALNGVTRAARLTASARALTVRK
ncbi:MAG: hypothetical protein F6K24_31145 [Okeania sp. SIO2D1]|nr:hypothetical protein [Okeania sp. SIO2D1]